MTGSFPYVKDCARPISTPWNGWLRLLEEQRDYQAAIGNAQRLLRHDPLHEATYRRLIRLHALDGDRAGALRVYHTCATVLQRELDVEPSAATREAYEQLLGAESRTPCATDAKAASSPLVGREKEWAQMLQAWRGVAAGGGPHVVMLCGEAGIGKTRLVEELLQWAARQGIATRQCPLLCGRRRTGLRPGHHLAACPAVGAPGRCLAGRSGAAAAGGIGPAT